MSQSRIANGESASGVGIAGLAFSILGWFSCGLLCIPGILLSFVGLFRRGPKGYAVAGLLVGLPGAFLFAFFGLSMFAGVLGLGTNNNEANKTDKLENIITDEDAPIQLYESDLKLDIDLGTPVPAEEITK